MNSNGIHHFAKLSRALKLQISQFIEKKENIWGMKKKIPNRRVKQCRYVLRVNKLEMFKNLQRGTF